MPDDREYLTQEEAARLWARAARLQVDDAREAEARAAREAAGRLDADAGGAPDGYALTHVRTAAVEAGIGADFFDAALADLRAERAAPASPRGPGGRLAHVVLGRPDDAVTVRRVIRAGPSHVLTALEAVLPAAPYNLTLRDQRGDPADGGVLIFDVLGASLTGHGGGGFAGEASWADFRQVLVSPRELGGDPTSVELTVRAPVGPSVSWRPSWSQGAPWAEAWRPPSSTGPCTGMPSEKAGPPLRV